MEKTKTKAKIKIKEVVKPKESISKKYIEAVGRRKTSTARVRIFLSGSGVEINGKDQKSYFPTVEMQNIISAPLKEVKKIKDISVSAKINGGGIHSQAEALRHGLSRALVKFDQEFRAKLKKAGFLKRDPRMKERRKFGLKKARKAPQWSKR